MLSRRGVLARSGVVARRSVVVGSGVIPRRGVVAIDLTGTSGFEGRSAVHNLAVGAGPAACKNTCVPRGRSWSARVSGDDDKGMQLDREQSHGSNTGELHADVIRGWKKNRSREY
jgi:hypothetical protein